MITPSFSLDFTAPTLDPAVTFTRAGSTATRVNASGEIEPVAADTPRFDFDPISLICKGLLIEEQRANLWIRSEELNDAIWLKGRASITANAATAPDGTLTADKLVEDTTASNTHQMVQIASMVSGTAYTATAFVKKDGRDFIALVFSTVNSVFNGNAAYFNLTTGTVVSAGTGITASIEDFGDGYYRIRATQTAAATASGYILFALSATGTSIFYTGNGTSGAYIWGAQLEAGAFATSYIPTTTAAVTRNADVATITGTNFSDFWQASKGGAQVQAIPSTVSGIRPLVQYDDGTANEIIALRGNTTNPELYIVDGGTPQAQLDAGTIAANTAYSLTGWWATNDCKARLDSGAVVTDTSATIPTVTQARLGSDGTNYLNGHLASISYYESFSGQIYTRRKNKAIFNLI